MNEGVIKLIGRKNIPWQKIPFRENLLFWHKKSKCYPVESFANCFCLRDNPNCKASLKNKNYEAI